MQTLKQIRADIDAVNTEFKAVKGSIQPIDDIEARLRSYLTVMADPARRLVDLAANALAYGHPVSEIGQIQPSQLRIHALGLAVAAMGVDEIIAQAKAKAAAQDNGAPRMDQNEREERLEELSRERYALELQEEATLNGAPRRPGVNAAAVIGIPLEVAIERDLLTAKG